jgi:hypothetical protein
MNKDVYRLNVRFDLHNAEEAEAVCFLKELSETDCKSRNRFIVNAVLEQLRRQGKSYDFSLDDIRQVFKEELQGLSVATPAVLPAEEQSLSEEQKAANAASVLSALEMFG